MAYDNEQYVVLYTTNRSFQRSFSKKCVCVCVYDTPDDGGRKVTAQLTWTSATGELKRQTFKYKQKFPKFIYPKKCVFVSIVCVTFISPSLVLMTFS